MVDVVGEVRALCPRCLAKEPGTWAPMTTDLPHQCVRCETTVGVSNYELRATSAPLEKKP